MKDDVIFVAASFLRHDEARAVRAALVAAGYQVRARWLDEPAGAYMHSPSAMEHFAMMDLQDLDLSDAIVCLTGDGDKPSRGGKHVEFGVAYEMGLEMYVLGPRENVYHFLPGVKEVATVEQLIALLGRERTVAEFIGGSPAAALATVMGETP